jgi:hypothetical protein
MGIAVTLVTLLAKYGPEVYAAAVAIIHKKDPVQSDFEALHALVQAAVANAAAAVADAKA